MRFAFIDAEKATFPVAALCRVLGVTRQGYYAHATRPKSTRLEEEARLHARIRELHDESKQTYGSPRIHRALRVDGTRVGKPRVERALRSMGLRACPPRRFRLTTKAVRETTATSFVVPEGSRRAQGGGGGSSGPRPAISIASIVPSKPGRPRKRPATD